MKQSRYNHHPFRQQGCCIRFVFFFVAPLNEASENDPRRWLELEPPCLRVTKAWWTHLSAMQLQTTRNSTFIPPDSSGEDLFVV